MIHAHANTFDAADAAALAGFWSEALGQPVDPGGSDEFASIGMEGDDAPAGRWMFIKVPEQKSSKNRQHVDFAAVDGDLEAEVERLVGLGATRHGDQEMPTVKWVTLSDPEGNEFDVFVPVATE
jgi:Glyoxalase-like domain